MTYEDKRVVDVIIDCSRNGIPNPRVIKRDGKYYQIQEVKRVRFDSGSQRVPREKYLVNINGYDKYLIKEGNRWYIINESEDERIFSHPALTPVEAMAI